MARFELPMPTELRYVYRALLRAATYLPDPLVRTYVHDTVVKRFRATSSKIQFRARHDELPKLLIDRYHGHKSILALRRTVNKLDRATLGSADDLKDVLLRAYGRLGRRRRELLTKFMVAEESELPINDQALEDIINNHLVDKQPRFGPNSKFNVLQKSQMATQTALIRKSRRLKAKDVQIPKENMWGRPLPLKLALSLKKKNFAWSLDRMFPPLPDHEWDRLRDLATGVIPTEKPRPRRPRAGGREHHEGAENDLALLKYFTTPVEVSKPRLSPVTMTPNGLTAWKQEAPELNFKKLSHFSPRRMRRIYCEIWQNTPKMVQDAVTKTWTVVWGHPPTEVSGKISIPGTADLELFEGYEDLKLLKVTRGQRPNPPNPNKKKRDNGLAFTVGETVMRSVPLGPDPSPIPWSQISP